MGLYISNKMRESIATNKLISPFAFIDISIKYEVTLARMINNKLVKLCFVCADADDCFNKLAVQANTDDETFELISRLSIQRESVAEAIEDIE